MSITEELREWAEKYAELGAKYAAIDLIAIADRIDAAHEEALRAEYTRGKSDGFDDWCSQREDAMAEHGWVRMPEGADGEYWFCGDKIMLPDGNVVEIIGIGGDWLYYCVASVAITVFGRIRAHDKCHYHVPTVEDVLHEFICDHEEGVRNEVDLIAEYAAKLRLAGDAE